MGWGGAGRGGAGRGGVGRGGAGVGWGGLGWGGAGVGWGRGLGRSGRSLRTQPMRARRTPIFPHKRLSAYYRGEHDVDEIVWLEGHVPREHVYALEDYFGNELLFVRHP